MSKENELVEETEGVSRRGFLKGIGSGAVAEPAWLQLF